MFARKTGSSVKSSRTLKAKLAGIESGSGVGDHGLCGAGQQEPEEQRSRCLAFRSTRRLHVGLGKGRMVEWTGYHHFGLDRVDRMFMRCPVV